jgi:predicted transglutaminase-like cysteine proteinase
MMRVPLTPARRDELDRVNAGVNANTSYTTDAANYGRSEWWEAAESKGDCEDYALAKRLRLRALGWPQGALDIALCWTEDAQYHAVLVAHADQGDFVLDNRSNIVGRWDECPYRWDRVSVDGTLTKWVEIKV